MPTETMTRGILAKRSGIPPETILYYERMGVLEEPRKSPAGHRVYGDGDLTRLRFIRQAVELGFSLVDVRELLALRLQNVAECSRVERRAARRLADVRKRIEELERTEQGLRELIASCRQNPWKANCPLFEVLEREV